MKREPSKRKLSHRAKAHTLIEGTMAVILRHDLSADHAKTLLGRTIQLLEWGKQAVNKLPEANA